MIFNLDIYKYTDSKEELIASYENVDIFSKEGHVVTAMKDGKVIAEIQPGDDSPLTIWEKEIKIEGSLMEYEMEFGRWILKNL